MPFLKSCQHWNLGWCYQGFSTICHCLFLIFAIICAVCCFFFNFFIFIGDYLSLSFAFSPHPPEWIYWCSSVFSFISSPASRTIPFFFLVMPSLLIGFNCPSILKCKRLAMIQVVYVCFFPFLSSASSECG